MTFTSTRAPSKLVAATIFSLIFSTMTLQSLPAEASVGGNGVCETANFAGGDGGSGNPYLIADKDDLRELGDCIVGGSTLGEYFELTGDIDVETDASSPWTALGTRTDRFEGNLNGGGFSISNLFTSDAVYQGLFASSGSSARITNLVVLASISGYYSGALVGTSKPGFEFSSISASVVFRPTEETASNNDAAMGGIVGIIETPTSVGDRKPSTFSGIAVQVAGSPNHHATGGVLGKAENTGGVTIEDSSVSGGWRQLDLDPFAASAGGFIGRLTTGRIINSHVRASISIDSFGKENTADGRGIGGLIGALNGGSVLASSFRGSLAYGAKTNGGGLIGSSGIRTASISGSYAVANFSVFGQSQLSAGGLIGNGSSTPITNSFARFDLRKLGGASQWHGGVLGVESNASVNYNSVYWTSPSGITKAFGASENGLSTRGGITEVAFANSGNSGSYANFDIASSSTFDSDMYWNICDFPYLTAEGQNGCNPTVLSATLGTDGKTISVETSGTLASTSTPNSSIAVSSQGQSLALANATNSISGDEFVFELASTLLTGANATLDYSNDNADPFKSPSSLLLASVRGWPIVNNSQVTGPAAGFGTATMQPNTIEIGLTCGGSCGSADSYDYVASITPAGGSPTTISGTANSTVTTLSFTALTPNVTHTIQASVTNNGQTSATASTTVTTPKLVATISAISVLDVSATLTVGCTNCGAAPDSFTVSATPVAGGAAITSNTNVISSLSPETTYSFSVVVAFAGTISDVVLWQDNPVMTLPLVPVISAVSPAALPLAGGSVTVTGSNFTTSSLLTLDGASLGFTIVSGTEITISAPAKTAGSYDLAITNLVGTFTLSNAVTYVSGPRITVTSPIVGTTNGGTIVSITGTDLVRTSEVTIGDTTVSFTVESDTLVRFVTPASSSGAVSISVTTPGGSTTSPVAFEYTTSALVPVIGAIAPTSGSTAGGTTITVTGQYFSGSYSDSVSAAINGISGSSIVLIDDSTLTFVSPPGAAATGLDVTVATGGGLGTLAGAFTYTAPPAPSNPGSAPPVEINTPTITEFSTREISASGAEVIATGLRLENVSVLTLGGITVTIVSNTSTSLTFTTGEMPVGVWDLRLVGSNGTLVFQQAIEVVEATAIVAESTGELLGYTWTFKFLGNSRSLHSAQREHLTGKLDEHSTAETIICWGYTTAENPNAWAIAHATQRAQAACDMASANDSELKTVVRLRYGVSKNWAMRSALQFWR